jgi:membrane-associated phospholipid phosphatase
VVAIVQWFRDRRAWLRWVLTLSTMMLLGVILYMLVPTAPPWLASPLNLVGPVTRVGTRSLHYLHLNFADKMWKKGAASTNEVAAFPSLHLGFTVMVATYFWRTAKPWLRVLLVAYPLLMMFSLVYSGEHYVFDCLAGAALAFLVVWINRRYMPRLFPKLLDEDQPLNRNASSSLVNSNDSSSTSAG